MSTKNLCPLEPDAEKSFKQSFLQSLMFWLKGGNYKLSENSLKRICEKIFRFYFVKGKSTTNLINLIVNRYGSKKI
jgi:hypothetical protein